MVNDLITLANEVSLALSKSGEKLGGSAFLASDLKARLLLDAEKVNLTALPNIFVIIKYKSNAIINA